jgi:hypothetical protein
VGRVLFTPKSEPAVDWSEIESRLQDISTGAPSPDLPIEPSATLANDPSASVDPPEIAPGDPLDMLSLLTAIPSDRS